MSDSQSRKWQITINNPTEKGLTHDKLTESRGFENE
nr:MAG TPA: Papillomavirus helicase [Inoviridae sp.]